MVSVTTHKKKDLEKIKNALHIYKEPTTLDMESNMESMESVMERDPVNIPDSIMESHPLVDTKISVTIMESDTKSPKTSPEVEINTDWKALLEFWSTLQSYEEFEKEIRSFKLWPIQMNLEMELHVCHKIDVKLLGTFSLQMVQKTCIPYKLMGMVTVSHVQSPNLFLEKKHFIMKFVPE